MSTRTMIAAAVFMGALAAPATAQQHQHGQAEEQEPGMMMSCTMMQQMMQGMHGQMGGMDMRGEEGRMEGMNMQGEHGQMDGMDIQGMRGQMDSGMMQMMECMQGGPGMILQSSEALSLTADQTERLEALQEGVRPEVREHMEAAMGAHREAATALEGDAPDLDAYDAALNEAADHMVTVHVAMARVTLEAREILSPDQREKLGSMMSKMQGMHGGMMPSGMKQGDEGGSGHDGHH